MRSIDSPPPVWVQMSTAHIYGDPPKSICTEESAFGYGLAPFVGRAWEEAFHASVLPSQRSVILRTSFVLGRNRGTGGGALDMLAILARLGLGGKVGNGTQGMSWIHETDMNRLFERGLTNSAMQGAYIASHLTPLLKRNSCENCAAPSECPRAGLFLLDGANRCPIVVGTDPELVLYGRYVISKRLEEEGFEFRTTPAPRSPARPAGGRGGRGETLTTGNGHDCERDSS